MFRHFGITGVVTGKIVCIFQGKNGREGFGHVDAAFRGDGLDPGGAADVGPVKVDAVKNGVHEFVDRAKMGPQP